VNSSAAGKENYVRACARLPEHVVYRSFVNETVVLNLQTGRYHGLNPTGGRILQLLVDTSDVEHTVARLAAESGREIDEIGPEVQAFCDDLAVRGLVEIVPADD
jgi:hypothetical protein